jgi:hypothetical protein
VAGEPPGGSRSSSRCRGSRRRWSGARSRAAVRKDSKLPRRSPDRRDRRLAGRRAHVGAVGIRPQAQLRGEPAEA